jgi:hypothetical protein
MEKPTAGTDPACFVLTALPSPWEMRLAQSKEDSVKISSSLLYL